MYGFSFEYGTRNTLIGSAEQGIATADSHESAVIRLQNAAMYLLSSLLMLPLIRSIGAELRRNVLLTALLLWAIASCVWSNDPSASLTNGVRMILDVALGLYLVTRYAVNDLMKLLVLVGAVAAASSLGLICAFPQYGLQSRELLYAFGAWQGIFGQKNICGEVMTLLLLPAFFVTLYSHWARAVRGCYVIVLLVIIGMTGSTGSWLLCGSCLAFIGALSFLVKLRRTDAWTVGTVLLGIAVATIVGILSNADSFLRLIGKDPTMTGRTVIWSALMVSIVKHPFLGYGYMAFWRGLSGESANAILQLRWPGMTYAENGILELWLELGAVGVFLYALLFARAVKDAVYCCRRHPSPANLWFASVLFLVGVENIAGGKLLGPSSLASMLPFVAYVGLRKEAERLRCLRPSGVTLTYREMGDPSSLLCPAENRPVSLH
jgi:O-antigen ligase